MIWHFRFQEDLAPPRKSHAAVMKFEREDFSGKNLIFRKVNNYVNIRNNS